VNSNVINGFNEEVEKLAFIGALAKGAIGAAKVLGRSTLKGGKFIGARFKKRPIEKLMIGSGVLGGASTGFKRATPRVVPRSTNIMRRF